MNKWRYAFCAVCKALRLFHLYNGAWVCRSCGSEQ